MNKKPALVSILTLLTLAAAAGASSSATFDEILKPYEAVRLALLEDTVDGVGERAAAIRKEAEAAADADSTADDVRPLLEKIAGFAGDLAEASDLETARGAFYEISKMLVQYRSKVSGDDLPVVMYCPMAKKSWLQLAGEVGNPYHGQSMPRCGNVVSD